MKKLEKFSEFDVKLIEKKNLNAVTGGATSNASNANATGVETDTCKGTTIFIPRSYADTSEDGDYISTC